MATPRFSHLRAGDLANLNIPEKGLVIPVKVIEVHDGTAATVVVTASRGADYPKGLEILTAQNLRFQGLTARTKSQTTLLVFKRTA